MSDDESAYTPEVSTAGIERILRDEYHCVKTTKCTARVCIWKTPGGHSFMAPNPKTVPRVPATTLGHLRRIIRELDDLAID